MKVRATTIELIVDEQDWVQGINIPPDKPVPVKIAFGETELREKVKCAGAYWHAENKVWMLSYRQACLLGLERRIVDELEDMGTTSDS